MKPLQVTENLCAQIEHHLLAGPLHDVGLGKFQQEAEEQQANVHGGDLRDAGKRPRAEEAVEQRMGFCVAGEILVDGDFGEIWPENIGARLQYDGYERHRDLPAIGVQIRQQALHQPGVVCLA